MDLNKICSKVHFQDKNTEDDDKNHNNKEYSKIYNYNNKEDENNNDNIIKGLKNEDFLKSGEIQKNDEKIKFSYDLKKLYVDTIMIKKKLKKVKNVFSEEFSNLQNMKNDKNLKNHPKMKSFLFAVKNSDLKTVKKILKVNPEILDYKDHVWLFFYLELEKFVTYFC